MKTILRKRFGLFSLLLMPIVMMSLVNGCSFVSYPNNAPQISTMPLTPVVPTISITKEPTAKYQTVPLANIPSECHIWGLSSDLVWMVVQCNTKLMVEKIGTEEAALLFDVKQPLAGFYPFAFSPDGTKLVVIEGYGGAVWLFDVGQWKTPKMLYPETQTQRLSFPTWSPDGKTIAVTYLRGDSALSILDLTGNVQDLLTIDDVAKWDLTISSSFGPVWSSQSDKLYYLLTDIFDQKNPTQIWSINVVSGKRELLYSGTSSETGLYDPNRSPDGTKLALIQDRDGSSSLFIYDQTNNTMSLVENFPSQILFSWSPDSENIAFRNNFGQLHVISVLSKEPEYIGYYDFLLGWKDKNNIIVENDGVLELIFLQ